MSVDHPQDMEDSGEIIFQTLHHSAVGNTESVNEHSSPMVGSNNVVSESGFSQSENKRDEKLEEFQKLIVEQLSHLNEKMEGQFLHMNHKIDGQLHGIRKTISEVREDSGKLWDVVHNKGNNPVHHTPSFPPTLEYMGNHNGESAQNIPITQRHTPNFPRFQRADNCVNVPFSQSTPHFPSQVHPNRNQNRGLSPTNSSHGNSKPRTFDGNEDFDDYLSQFEIIAEINRWDYTTKSLHLAGKLAGQACGILGELSDFQRRDYDSLVNALKMRFGSLERSEMFRARLKARTKGTNESLSEFAQSIKKLTRQAYPKTDPDLIDLLALDHFIDTLPDKEMRIRIRKSRPRNIGEAEITAIRLETYKFADSQKESHVNSVTSKDGNGTETLLEKFLNKFDQTLNGSLEKIREEISKVSQPNQGQGRQFQRNGNNNYRPQNWDNQNQGNRRPGNYQSQGNWQNNPRGNGNNFSNNRGNGNNFPNQRGNGNNFPQNQNRNAQQGNGNMDQGNALRSSFGVGNRPQ